MKDFQTAPSELHFFQLYDLMTMAFKYQVSLALRPKDILLITLNHMDSIRSYVEDNSTVYSLVEYGYKTIIEVSRPISCFF